MIDRFMHDQRLQIIVGIISVVIFGAIPIIIGYAQSPNSDELVRSARVVHTDGDHCAITLPAGWTWRVASWTAVSPNGTELGFSEIFMGRPENPSWEEVAAEVERRAATREGAELTRDGDTIRIDYGPNGGLGIVHRFDWIACRLTFSGAEENKSIEMPVWEEIIDSLVRISPTGTPPEELPWRPND